MTIQANSDIIRAMYMRTGLLALIALAAAVNLASAQGVTRTLDFLALDRDGRPVTDLTSAELELKIDGKARPITRLERIANPDGGRHILILLEEATVYSLEPVVRDGVKKLLASLGTADEVTLVSTRQSDAPVVEGVEAITRAVESLTTGPGTLYSCLADTLRNIERMATRLPRGRASTLALLARGHPEGATGNEADAAPCTPRRDAMRKASAGLANRQINMMLFTVDETNRSWGLETLARNIGATPHLLTWADTGSLAEAIGDVRSFYRASFEVAAPAPDRPLRVDLKVKGRSVRIQTSPVLTLTPGTQPLSTISGSTREAR
jgi:hypothetical protein